jgi:hypothetical protein
MSRAERETMISRISTALVFAGTLFSSIACSQSRRQAGRSCEKMPGEPVTTARDYSINRVLLDEGESYFICFTGPATKIIGPSIGELLLLPHGTILIVGKSSHYMVRESTLLNRHGDTIAVIKHGEISRFGSSEDGRVFWLIEFRVASGASRSGDPSPAGLIRVFDARGEPVMTREFSAPEILRMTVNGRSYIIQLPKPEIPG